MKTNLVLLQIEDGGSIRSEILFETTSPEALTQFTFEVKNIIEKVGRLSAPRPESERAPSLTNSRRVYILAVDELSPFNNLKPEDVLQSATFLSFNVMGYKYNAVAQALGLAKRRGETAAKLQGLTFCYEDSLAANVD